MEFSPRFLHQSEKRSPERPTICARISSADRLSVRGRQSKGGGTAVALVALWCGWAVASCWVPAETGRQIQADLRDLQRALQEAQKGLAEQRARLDEQIQRAERQVKEVETALRDLNRAARLTDADFGVKLERMVREVQELRGAAELADYRLNKVEELGGRLDTLKQLHDGAANSQGATQGRPESKSELLAHAEKMWKAGNATEARGAYREIIRRWSHEEGVTDLAYFRLAELYYNERNCPSAIQEYIQVIEKFGKGSWVDDSYFKLGECSVKQGNLDDAQIFFGEVVKNHSRSPLAKSARAKLDEVRKLLAKEKSSKKAKSKSKRRR